MVISEVLQEIKNNLLKYEYPLANAMSDEELADVFTASNRPFLMAWMIKLLGIYDGASITADNPQLLSYIMYENGFCTKDQADSFIYGYMSPIGQFEILENIFIYINVIKKPKPESDLKYVTLAEIDDLFKKNLNLFPQYGEIKSLTKEEKLQTVTEVQTDIGVDQQNNAESEESATDPFGTFDNADIAKLLVYVNGQLPIIKEIAKDCQKAQENSSNILLQKDDEVEKVVQQCGGYLRTINQYLRDVTTIDELFKSNGEWLAEPADRTHGEAHRQILRSLHPEISSILKIFNLKKQ